MLLAFELAGLLCCNHEHMTRLAEIPPFQYAPDLASRRWVDNAGLITVC